MNTLYMWINRSIPLKVGYSKSFNLSILESQKHSQGDTSGVNSNREVHGDSVILPNDYSQLISYSTDKKPKQFAKKKSARSSSKIAALITKEYKEDLAENQEFIKAKLGHSNSFESKLTNFNTINISRNLSRRLILRLFDFILDNYAHKPTIQTLNPVKNNPGSKVRYGTLAATLDNKTFNSLLDPECKPSKRLEQLLVKQRNENRANIEHSKHILRQNQPRYSKNINLPAVISKHKNVKPL